MTAIDCEPAIPLPSVHQRPRSRVAGVIAAVFAFDAFALALAVILAHSVKFGPGNWSPSTVDWLSGYPAVDFGWVVPLWLAVLTLHGGYSKRRFVGGDENLRLLLNGSIAAALAASMAAYLLNHDMSRAFFAYFFAIGTALLITERYCVRAFITRSGTQPLLTRRVIVAGGEKEVRAVADALARRRSLGYEIVGACLPNRSGNVDAWMPGDANAVVHACRRFRADTLLVVGGSHLSSADLRDIVWSLEGDDIELVVVPSLLDVAGPRIRMRPLLGLPFIHVEPPQAARAMRWGKAAFDRFGALLLLVLLGPVIIAVAAAVWLEGGAPILFKHRRVGVGGNHFAVWKFRSMVHSAEAMHAELVSISQRGPLLFKQPSDPRVTRVGAFIRRYSLDELPQLVNVLRGEMSLVGPRPQVPAEVAHYKAFEHRRLLVRPGITGLWQVSGRSNLSWDEAVRLDLYYVDNWSPIADLQILAKTVRAVFRHDGAY